MDFAEMVSVLSEPDHPVGMRFSSATFASALDRVYEGLTAGGDASPGVDAGDPAWRARPAASRPRA